MTEIILSAVSDPVLPELKNGGSIALFFDTAAIPDGLLLEGDAHIGSGGTLALDGQGDYAEFTEQNAFEGVDYLSVDLDFRFADAIDMGPAALAWNQGAFGIRVDGGSLIVTVMQADGSKEHMRVPDLGFDDLDWHNIALSVDELNDVLVVTVDGQTVIERTDLDLDVPDTDHGTTLGGSKWGQSLNGEIDNVKIATERPTGGELFDGASLLLSASSAVGLADPGLSMDAGTFLKWNESTAVPFIDRMKGAYAWDGKYATPHQDSGSTYVLDEVNVFQDSSLIEQMIFTSDMLVNLNKLLVRARFTSKIIDKDQYSLILENPNDYFRVEADASGISQLLGRLDIADPFAVIGTFDTDVGMDLNGLRDAGHMFVTPSDFDVGFSELTLDENGWPIHLPTDIAGNVGQVSTAVFWYPAEAAAVPNGIYAGRFYLMAEGEGTLDLRQYGSEASVVNLRGIQIDGPTVVPFDYTPNGERLMLTLKSSDPANNGEYLRDIKIVHEDHLEQFEAGEVFTPEFVDFHADYRVIRWMRPMSGTETLPFVEGDFEDRPSPDYYSFNLGTGITDENGFPIDLIIDFSNKTGTDPWITVPVNASDSFVQGMATYIEANLDPRLKVHVELGNEIWNGLFDSYRYASDQAVAEWGELKLETDANGQFVRDANGDLIVLAQGRFFSRHDAEANGYASLDDLTAELGLAKPLYSINQGWAEWGSMRATQIGKIFEDVFLSNDPLDGAARLNNVMGTFTHWAKSTDFLMQGTLWQEEDPNGWIDPASVFETLAIGAYFGGSTGSRDADLVSYWIDTYGEAQAKQLVVHHLKVGLDPAQTYIAFDKHAVDSSGNVQPGAAQSGVVYDPALIVDVSDAIYWNNQEVRNDIRTGTGLETGEEVLLGSEVHDYVRLSTDGAGNTILQLRVDPASGSFQTLVTYDGTVAATIDDMLHDGTLIVRGLESMADRMEGTFPAQKAKADQYGLELVAYEGGQHFASAVWGIFRDSLSNEQLIDLLHDLNDSPVIADLYQTWLSGWQEMGGGAFTHYLDYSMPSRFGNWGTVDYLGQENEAGAPTHKLDTLEAINAAGAWWSETRAPDAFLQGITDTGTTGDDSLIGTVEEDILLGGDGDDYLFGGPGDDRLHGGSGVNTLDGEDGDDTLVFTSTAETFYGGAGQDTLRLAAGIATLDLAAVSAVDIEAVDARNYAPTTLSAAAPDVFAFNTGNALTLHMETTDSLTLDGFLLTDIQVDGTEIFRQYEATIGSDVVTLTVVTDNASDPDIVLI